MVSRIVLDLVERVGALAPGQTAELSVTAAEAQTVAAWCERSGNELLEVSGGRAVVRRGRRPGDDEILAELAPDQQPGARLWLYTNFDCNLACDYCCAESSPRAARRALELDTVRRVVTEAAGAGVREIFLTGGEPFLVPDIGEIVEACTRVASTTVLTNGMLFKGTRLAVLRRMPREGLALQVSLDSADPATHDRHRGRGSWDRAVTGVRVARAEGFRVRVAATVAGGDDTALQVGTLRALLDDLGIPPGDQVVRPVARQGFAGSGVVLSVDTLLPEVTVAADGVYWHPVGVTDPEQLVTREIFPLTAAIGRVRRRFVDSRRSTAAMAERFPCA